MQFQVPQFIEVEDKIFGPLTFKQFIYITGGAGCAYLLYRVLPIYIAGPLILGAGGLAAALAFLQWNGRPFIIGIENAFYFLVHSKLYLWNNKRKSKQKIVNSEQKVQEQAQVYIPKISDSKLHELAWSLDIKERIAAGVADERERGGIIAPIRTAREARI